MSTTIAVSTIDSNLLNRSANEPRQLRKPFESFEVGTNAGEEVGALIGPEQAPHRLFEGIEVDRTCRRHRGQIDAIFWASEERFENRQVRARQHRQPFNAGEGNVSPIRFDMIVERMVRQKDVDWSLAPPQPALPIAFELTTVRRGRSHPGWKGVDQYIDFIGAEKDVDIDVLGCPWLLRTKCQRQRATKGVSDIGCAESLVKGHNLGRQPQSLH